MKGLTFRREVLPEVVEAIGAAEQRGEDGQVCQQDVASPRACRRHPKEAVEFSVSGLDKWMRSGQIDRLPSKNSNCVRIFRRQRIMRQVLMKIEGRYVR